MNKKLADLAMFVLDVSRGSEGAIGEVSTSALSRAVGVSWACPFVCMFMCLCVNVHRSLGRVVFMYTCMCLCVHRPSILIAGVFPLGGPLAALP